MQLNYHGLIRQFDDCQYGEGCYDEENLNNTQMPQLSGGSAVSGDNGESYNLLNNEGNIHYGLPWPIMNKNLACLPERDADANGDGVVTRTGDVTPIVRDGGLYNKRVNQSGYDENYDIACRDKINVVALSRIGLNYNRGA